MAANLTEGFSRNVPLVSELDLARALKRDRRAVRIAVEQGRLTHPPKWIVRAATAIEEFLATTHHEKGHNNRSAAAKKPAGPELTGGLPDIPAPEIPLPTETKSTAYAKARAGSRFTKRS